MTDTVLHPLTRLHGLFNDPDIAYWDGQNRERIDETHEDWLIDNLIPIGCSVIYADPGAGKSFIMLSVIHHLVYGTPLGPWGSQGAGRALCLVYDLEGTWKLTQDRGYAVTPYGTVGEDGDPNREDNWCLWAGDVIAPAEREAWKIIGNQAKRHTQYLEQVLTDAETAGAPIRLVVIDTLSKFVGPKPQKAAGNAYEYEAAVVDAINRIALRHRCAVVLIHHTNKQGEISGSQGIGGSAIVTAKLDVEEQTDDQRADGETRKAVLRSTKVRIGAPFTYSMEQRADGPWEFVDRPPNEALARGQSRKVHAALNTYGSQTYAELLEHTRLGNTLRTCLNRMRWNREIFTAYGKWHLRRPDVVQRTLPGQADGECTVCGGPMTIIVSQGIPRDRHPGCVPERDPWNDDVSRETGPEVDHQEPAEPEPEPEPDPWNDDVSRETEQDRTDALALLRSSIAASRMKPIMFIRKEHRPAEPWTLIREVMTGEFRWIAPGAADVDPRRWVAVLDRNGSYPSAMSSVTVAPNILTHSGALPDRNREDGAKLAGIFRVLPPEWDDRPIADGGQGIGHPFGRIMDQLLPDGTCWVPTQHIETAEKLAARGRIAPVPLLDSWTGRATGGLYTAYSREHRKLREELAGPGQEAELRRLKARSSAAIRMIWPAEARSPLWRPDHSVSIRAEAAQRLWWRGDQAAQAGAQVLRLSTVDEIVILLDDEADHTAVPPPFKIGVNFGEVTHKDVTIVRARRATSTEPAVAAVKAQSPMTVETWRSSVPSLRNR